MSFVSFKFLGFITAVILLYFIVPKKYRWVELLIASYVFYYLCSKQLVLVHLGTTLWTFFIGKQIGNILQNGKTYLTEHKAEMDAVSRKAYKAVYKTKAKRLMFLGIFTDLAVLLFMKYFNFFGSLVNPILIDTGHSTIPVLNLLLPLGISFYTLQAMAYLIDIYREKIAPDTNPLKFMLFMAYFPQLTQGPIPRHKQLASQLYEGHDFSYERLCNGLQLMLWGYFQKIVIADRAAIPVNTIFGSIGSYHGMQVFFAAALYGLQIYADFNGGMDIIRGFSQILGIELELNFQQPYFAQSVEEFWRRWHITLGSWMRDYVFYPLSLSKAFVSLSRNSRKLLGNYVGKKLPSFLSMFVVYLLVGFWHGAGTNYIAYGLWNGAFIMSSILLEAAYARLKDLLGIDENLLFWQIFRMIRTFIILSVGRIFTKMPTAESGMTVIRSIGNQLRDLSFLSSLKNLGIDDRNWTVLLVATLVLFLVDFLHEKNVHIRENVAKQHIIFRWSLYYLAIIVILVFGIYGPAYNASEFIYQGF